MQKDAIVAPATIDSSMFLPAIFDESIPPAKASPAPVVSITLLTGYAFIEKEVSLSKKVVDYCGGNEKLYETVFNSYRQNYSEEPYKYSTLMPGVMNALNYFNNQKIPMGICTNKRQFVTEKLIKQMNLDKFFDVIIGAKDNIPLKPKPDMIQITINQFNSIKGSFFMVGDTSNDIDAAKAANIKSIAVNGGYTHVDINSLGADYTLETMEEIIDLFKSFKLGPN